MGMGFGGIIRSWMGSEVGHDGARAEVDSSMRWFAGTMITKVVGGMWMLKRYMGYH